LIGSDVDDDVGEDCRGIAALGFEKAVCKNCFQVPTRVLIVEKSLAKMDDNNHEPLNNAEWCVRP
jgi:hypothetical protein